MAEKDPTPQPPPRTENSLPPERPQFPNNRPINGDNRSLPGLISGR